MPQQQVCSPVHRRGPTWVPAVAQLTFPCSRMRCMHNAAQAAAAPRVWRAACRCFPWARTSAVRAKNSHSLHAYGVAALCMCITQREPHVSCRIMGIRRPPSSSSPTARDCFSAFSLASRASRKQAPRAPYARTADVAASSPTSQPHGPNSRTLNAKEPRTLLAFPTPGRFLRPLRTETLRCFPSTAANADGCPPAPSIGCMPRRAPVTSAAWTPAPHREALAGAL